MVDSGEREFDLVLVGATGFVGRLSAAELGRVAPPGARIALGGRSERRLADLQRDLDHPGCSWPTVLVDLGDADSVRALAARTRVVVTTAGPYATYGRLLVQACAEAGTHYADLTGETLFVRDTIAAAHDIAQRTGARIVPSCGFDSVPSDLGVGLTAERIAAAGDRLTAATLHVRSARGGISGGTIDSLRQQIIQASGDRAKTRILADAQALTGQPRVGDRPSSAAVSRDERTGRWQAPFVMGGYNRQIVWRSNALSDWSYGRDFSYREVIDTGTGLPGAVAAAGLSVGTGLLLGGMWLPPTRWLLDRVLPAPGDGPSEATLDRGRFHLEVVAETATGRQWRTRFGVELDPGYRGTAAMLAQAGLCLAYDDLPERSGVLTPMVAMGQALAERLRARNFTVETDVVAERS